MPVPHDQLYRCVYTIYVEARDVNEANKLFDRIDDAIETNDSWANAVPVGPEVPSNYWPVSEKFGWRENEPPTKEEVAAEWARIDREDRVPNAETRAAMLRASKQG